MKRKRLLHAAAMFFILMVCFTILSRAAWQEGTAVVQVGRPETRMITHQITAAGKVEQNQDLAVVTEPDQRVTAIHVQEGQRVEKGELLFEIDTKLLDEKILRQRQEMEKFQLQMEDAESREAVSAIRKANEQSQASENYSLSTGRANAQLSRAKQTLRDAESELENYRNQGFAEPQDETVFEQLEKDVEEKQDAYIQAEQELLSLQWRIEQAVSEELEKVSKNVSENVERVWEEEQSEEWPEEISSVQPADPGADISQVPGADTELWTDFAAEETDAAQWFTDTEPVMEAADIIPPSFDDAQETAPGTGGPAPLTDEELAQVETDIRRTYQPQLDEAREKAEAAKAEQETAQAAWNQYQQEFLNSADTKSAVEQQQLEANVRSAQEAYTDASIAANEASVAGARAVYTAGIPDSSDSTGKINEITYEQMQLELDKLEKLRENGGKICAPAEGLVTKIQITTGEKTSDTTAILLADLSKGYRFTADITKDQETYIGTGDLVTITAGNKKKKLEELPVSSVTADETDREIYHVTVRLPKDSLEIGVTANMELTKKSQAYETCVPLSALHLDDKMQTYVLLPEEYKSIMGTEIRARKAGVTVLEKNESYAALAEGSLSGRQDILVSADRPVDDGSRIRVSK